MKALKTLLYLSAVISIVCLSAVSSQAWTVSSQIYDADGSPVEGASLTLLGSTTCPLTQITVTMNSVTDRFGAASILNVPNGCFQAEASHPILGTVRARVGSLRSDVSDIRLELPGHLNGFEGWNIGGTVRATSGQPIADAHLVLIGVGGDEADVENSSVVHSDDQGRFHFSRIFASTCEIHAFADGFSRVVGNWEITDGHRDNLALTLLEERRRFVQHELGGRVIDAYSSPVEAAHVVAFGSLVNGRPAEIGGVVHTEDDGNFTLYGVEAANYGIQVFTDGLGTSGTPIGLIPGDANGLRFRLPGGIRSIGDNRIMINPVVVDFSEVERGIARRIPISIYNAGPEPLEISAQSVAPPDDGGCVIRPGCAPFLLAFYISKGGGAFTLEPGASHSTLLCCYSYNYGPHAAVYQVNIDSPVQAFPQVPLQATTLGVKIEKESIPSSAGITGAFPNPFNNSISIAFFLPKSTEATLEILDLCGRPVETLVKRECPAGSGTAKWDAQGSPAGMYYARLQAEGITSIHKVFLIR